MPFCALISLTTAETKPHVEQFIHLKKDRFIFKKILASRLKITKHCFLKPTPSNTA